MAVRQVETASGTWFQCCITLFHGEYCPDCKMPIHAAEQDSAQALYEELEHADPTESPLQTGEEDPDGPEDLVVDTIVDEAASSAIAPEAAAAEPVAKKVRKKATEQ